MPINAIARTMGCSKNTVKQALRSAGAPKYQRAPKGSLVDEIELRIRDLLTVWPTMPATVIAERFGWQHSIRILRDHVRDLRPAYPPTRSCEPPTSPTRSASAICGSPTSPCPSATASTAPSPGCRCWSPAIPAPSRPGCSRPDAPRTCSPASCAGGTYILRSSILVSFARPSTGRICVRGSGRRRASRSRRIPAMNDRNVGVPAHCSPATARQASADRTAG